MFFSVLLLLSPFAQQHKRPQDTFRFTFVYKHQGLISAVLKRLLSPVFLGGNKTVPFPDLNSQGLNNFSVLLSARQKKRMFLLSTLLDTKQNPFVLMLRCRKGTSDSCARRRSTPPARRDTFTPSETSATSREPLTSRTVTSPEHR